MLRRGGKKSLRPLYVSSRNINMLSGGTAELYIKLFFFCFSFCLVFCCCFLSLKLRRPPCSGTLDQYPSEYPATRSPQDQGASEAETTEASIRADRSRYRHPKRQQPSPSKTRRVPPSARGERTVGCLLVNGVGPHQAARTRQRWVPSSNVGSRVLAETAAVIA